MFPLARPSRSRLSLGLVTAALWVGCGQGTPQQTIGTATVSGAINAQWSVKVFGTGAGQVALIFQHGSIPTAPPAPTFYCSIALEGNSLPTGDLSRSNISWNENSFVCELNTGYGATFEGWGFGGGWQVAGEGAFSLTISSPGSASNTTRTYYTVSGQPYTGPGPVDWEGMHGTFATTLPPLAGNPSTADVTVDVVF